MKKWLRRIKRIVGEQKNYFTEFGQEIGRRNLQLIQTVFHAVVFIYCGYFIFTRIFFPERALPWTALLPVAGMLLFMMGIHWELKKKDISKNKALVLVLLTYIFLMGVMIGLSVFPNPDVPSIYFHLFLVACPVLFILPIGYHMVIMIGSYILFAVLVTHFKAQAIWSHELFESFTALLVAFVMLILMFQFRIQTDSLKRKYFHLSQVDGLTGLLNKTSGIQWGEHYLQERSNQEHFAVLFVDVDSFKGINDNHGHLMGDEVLKAMSRALKSSCRAADLVCRFGGDEFLIVLRDIRGQEVVTGRVGAIMENIADIHVGTVKSITCSIGVYYVDGPGVHDFEAVLAKADDALYQAKESGRNCYRLVQ